MYIFSVQKSSQQYLQSSKVSRRKKNYGGVADAIFLYHKFVSFKFQPLLSMVVSGSPKRWDR